MKILLAVLASLFLLTGCIDDLDNGYYSYPKHSKKNYSQSYYSSNATSNAYRHPETNGYSSDHAPDYRSDQSYHQEDVTTTDSIQKDTYHH